MVRGRGCELYDADGRRWLDLCAGIAVCSLGHAHPAMVRAIAEQAACVMHVSNHFYNEHSIMLASELCRRTGFARAFFCNSGTEAVEALVKAARHYFFGLGDERRVRFVAFQQAFHGRTMGALALTASPKYREGFGPLSPVTHVPFGDLGAVEQAMGPDVCGIVVEPIQGEGGVIPAPEGFLSRLREIADAHGTLLLVDEIQTGVGRLGRFLGSDGTGARPDAVALAKGLAGGFPIGAMLTTDRLEGALPPGAHGSTFGGNALACATARAVLRVIEEEKVIESVVAKGAALGSMLKGLASEMPELCEGARGEGLLWGLVLRPEVSVRAVLRGALDRGVLLTPAGDRVVRFTPPLIITLAELEEGVRAVRGALAELPSPAASSPLHGRPSPAGRGANVRED
jgi:acetylornithine/N-succinyldiaminopimelate aminotransferase